MFHCFLFPLDEQTIPFKGKQTRMRQYNKYKPNKWSFKNFALCASDTGLNFEMYTGKANFVVRLEKTRSGRRRLGLYALEALNSIIESDSSILCTSTSASITNPQFPQSSWIG